LYVFLHEDCCCLLVLVRSRQPYQNGCSCRVPLFARSPAYRVRHGSGRDRVQCLTYGVCGRAYTLSTTCRLSLGRAGVQRHCRDPRRENGTTQMYIYTSSSPLGSGNARRVRRPRGVCSYMHCMTGAVGVGRSTDLLRNFTNRPGTMWMHETGQQWRHDARRPGTCRRQSEPRR
jgi:hypothetical protein